MKIIFFGDRDSKTIKLGWFLSRKLKLKKFVEIRLFDGYKSQIYINR